ncbi:MAG: bifunctional 3-hydroxydecanoyl-ACP dehydratase/trans-2-decenoyl-ACP isomerase [Syntrophales bacterium]
MMTYSEFKGRDHFRLEELIAFSYGTLVSDPPDEFDAHLPSPPLLMVDRILSIQSEGRLGSITAEQDIKLDKWFFQCHMPGDPVYPGCLCLDAIWQLLGFYCVWRGALGTGRALGCGEVSFNGQIRPYNRLVRFEISVRRYAQLKESGASLAIADGRIFVDEELIMTVNQARTGIFRGIAYKDYPKRSVHSVGGMIRNG